VSVPVEEYLRSVVAQEELVEYGIKASDVKRYILERRKYFSELIEDNFANIPLE
jgi:peptidoglycan hydrolase-like amidase